MEKNHQSNNVILLSTHIVNDFVYSQYRKLKRETAHTHDSVFLLVQEEYLKEINFPDDVDYYLFSLESLNRLGYTPIEESIVPGSNHFSVMQFYKDFPSFKYYWNIEFDVFFSGNWTTFFSAFESLNTDFLTSHIQRFDEFPEWTWWDTLSTKKTVIQTSKYIKSFNPIYRISNAALTELDQILASGISGHHEVLIPTLLNHFGFTIGDFGGNGSYVLPGFKERFYTPNYTIEIMEQESTMRFRPVYTMEEVELSDKLYHPIKGD